jgi:hypothetical protein
LEPLGVRGVTVCGEGMGDARLPPLLTLRTLTASPALQGRSPLVPARVARDRLTMTTATTPPTAAMPTTTTLAMRAGADVEWEL